MSSFTRVLSVKGPRAIYQAATLRPTFSPTPKPEAPDFYGQGATTSNASSITVPNGTSTLNVYDTGDLVTGSTLQAGIGGPTLTISSIQSKRQITVSNAGAGFSLGARSRLILTSDRPVLYQDILGATVLSSNGQLFADSNGKIVAYINRTRYDYVVAGNSSAAATIDSVTIAQSNSTASLTWQHSAAGDYRAVFVAIAYTGITGGETLSSVTYGGQAMTALSTGNSLVLYYLLRPPTGAQSVVVQWTGGNVAVVAGSFSAKGLILGAPTPSTGSGSATSAAVSFGTTTSGSLLFALLSLYNQSSSPTVTVPDTTMWNLTAGASFYFTTGGGARKVGSGSAATMTFTWSGSRSFETCGIEMRGIGGTVATRLATVGSTEPSPAWLNAKDFPSIQEAIYALPPGGGTVYIPSGEYVAPPGGIVVDRSCTIRGDTVGHTGLKQGTVIRPNSSASVDHVFKILSTVQNVHMYDCFIIGTHTAGSGHGVYAAAAAAETISGLFFENLDIRDMNNGFHLDASVGVGVNLVEIRNCVSSTNMGNGLYVSVGHGVAIFGGYMAANKSYGIEAYLTYNIGILEMDLQGNQANGTLYDTHSQLYLSECHGLNVIGCTLEDFIYGDNKANTALILDNCFGGSIDRCYFTNSSTLTSTTRPSRGILLKNRTCGIVVGSNSYGRTHVPVELAAQSGITATTILPQIIRLSSPYATADTILAPDESVSSNPTPSPYPTAGNVQVYHLEYPTHSTGVGQPLQYTMGIRLPKLPDTVWDPAQSTWAKAEGLVIYDATNKKLKYWDGSAWKTVTAT